MGITHSARTGLNLLSSIFFTIIAFFTFYNFIFNFMSVFCRMVLRQLEHKE